jgi:hypothetical protein
MIIKAKALEIGKIHFKTHLNIFVSNVPLTLKFLNFENVFLTKKKYSFFRYLTCGCIIYINDIDQYIVKSDYIKKKKTIN